MLEQLNITNFAIIENTSISFRKGMTVLTGETGAGKTIIIDAIGLLLGERGTTDMIRHGETKAMIEGVFRVRSLKLKEELVAVGILDTDEIIINRTLQEGRSQLRINGQMITQGNLKKIARYLLDIHLQHDTYRLIDPSNYLELLDNFAQTNLEEYLGYREEYMEAVDKYLAIESLNDTLLEQLDYMAFQLEELTDAELDISEELELSERQEQMENYDKIYDQISRTVQFLDQQTAANLSEAVTSLNRLSSMSSYQELATRLSSCVIEIDDIKETLSDKISDLDFNPQELERIQNRLVQINRLKRKYRMDVPELIEKQLELKDKLDAFENKDVVLKKQLDVVKSKHLALLQAAEEITKIRKEAALHLANSLVLETKELYMEHVQFSIQFSEPTETKLLDKNGFHLDGVDEIDFLISTNVGEPLKSLSKTASGGEMSRVMLGLKTVLLKAQNLSAIILDEIDSGVSGKVAAGIAKKVKKISLDTQVLLITHLPQVAATADHHIHVSKHVEQGRTVSETKYLALEERIEEVAKMLSNDSVTSIARTHAEELLHAAQD